MLATDLPLTIIVAHIAGDSHMYRLKHKGCFRKRKGYF